MAYLCFINSHLVSSHGRMGERALWGLFCQGTNPIHEGSSLMTQIISQRPHLQSPSFFRSGFQHMNFERTQTFSLWHNPSHNSTIKCLAKGGAKESPQNNFLRTVNSIQLNHQAHNATRHPEQDRLHGTSQETEIQAEIHKWDLFKQEIFHSEGNY